MRTFLILCLVIFFASCAQKPEEEVREAIDIALSYLSKSECSKAIKILEDAGVQHSNAIYLQVLASAYACEAGYDEIDFIANDLSSINATSAANIFKSFARLEISEETEADSADYVSIRKGLRLLLNPSSQTARESKFGSRKAGDMGVQALMLNVVNLGKFLNYYGNTNSTGQKGQGLQSNSCFINYTDARAKDLIASSVTGACVGDSDGHPDLSLNKRRMCEGVMTVTNIIDILNSLDFSSSSELEVFNNIATQINTIKVLAEAAGLGTLVNMTSQSECETYLATAANLDDMEFLFSMLFETGLQ